MSTTQERNTDNLPGANEVPASSIQPWRIASGKLLRGRGEGEEHPQGRICGYVRRFAIEEGVSDDGSPWKQLEVDLDTKEGFERIKVNYNSEQDMWPTQGVGLAKVLASIKSDWAIVIEPSLSKEPNKHGKHTTFVNVDRWNPALGRRELIQTEWDGMKFADIVDDVFEALGKHPLYKHRERTTNEDGTATEISLLEAELSARGFTPFAGNEAKWLPVINAQLKENEYEEVTLDQINDDDVLNFLRCQLPTIETDPLKAPAKKILGGKEKPPADKDDPFADE